MHATGELDGPPTSVGFGRLGVTEARIKELRQGVL
jgi:hypothetical protein